MRTRSITFMLWLVMLAFPHPALATWNASTGNPVCAATGDQLVYQLLSDNFQGTFVVWVDNRAGNNWGVYAQRMTREGTIASGWPTNGVSLCTASGLRDYPVIVSDGAGGLIVAWQDKRGSTWDIYAQRINGAGAVQWSANGIPVCTQTFDQTVPSIASDGAGGCFIAWADARGNLNDIYVRYQLALAQEGAGNAAEAKRLFKEVAIYNFNDASYALIRADAISKSM